MKYGYARVSTVGQHLNSQIDEIKSYGVRPKNIYHEKFTGKTTHRPQFEKLMKKLKAGDTLYVSRIDRLARNTSEALDIFKDLNDKGVKIDVFKQIGLIDSSYMGKFTITMLSAVADLERNLILERTEEGRKEAIKKGKHFGQRFRMQKNDKARKHYLAVYHTYLKQGGTKTAAIFDMNRTNVYKIKNSVENWLKYHKHANQRA